MAQWGVVIIGPDMAVAHGHLLHHADVDGVPDIHPASETSVNIAILPCNMAMAESAD
jgi:hypothetical protein